METLIKIVSSLGCSEQELRTFLGKYSETELQEIVSFLTDDCLLPSNEVTLLPHQLRVMRALLRGQRGVIAAYPMGSGKTITAIAASECLKNQAKKLGVDVHIYVIVPTSLIGNYKTEVDKTGYKWDPEDVIITKTKFFRRVRDGIITSLRNYIVIYDEAHTLRTDYRCEFCSDLVMALKGPQEGTIAETSLQVINTAWKVIGLTGTPIYNQPYDWVNLWALATGKSPPTYLEYSMMHETGNGLQNVFSFYDIPRDDFPRREDIYHLVPMTPEYHELYQKIEQKFRKKPKKSKKQKQGEKEEGNAFMVRLRTAMNKLKDSREDYIISEKVYLALKIISLSKRNVIVFSEFISHGLDVIRVKLNSDGIPWDEINGSVSAKKRDGIVKKYNSRKIKVLIITKAGGEGLNLKETSDIILLESSWTLSTEEQVIARGIRKGSHSLLQEKDRVVKVHHLLLIFKPFENLIVRFLGLEKKGGGYKPIKNVHQGDDASLYQNFGPDVYLKWYSRLKNEINHDEELLLRKYQLE